MRSTRHKSKVCSFSGCYWEQFFPRSFVRVLWVIISLRGWRERTMGFEFRRWDCGWLTLQFSWPQVRELVVSLVRLTATDKFESVGLILWGISIDKGYHWMVGQVAFFLCEFQRLNHWFLRLLAEVFSPGGAGIQIGNTVISSYIVDSYPLQSMSVITFYSVWLNFSAFADPVSLALILFPLVFPFIPQVFLPDFLVPKS